MQSRGLVPKAVAGLGLEAAPGARAAEQEASFSLIVRECAYLRQHVSLLEARFELLQKGFTGNVTQDIVQSRLTAVEDKLAAMLTSMARLESMPASQASESQPGVGIQDIGDSKHAGSLTNVELQEKMIQIDERLMLVEGIEKVAGNSLMSTQMTDEQKEDWRSDQAAYHIEESTWDSSIFVGFHCIGKTSSVVILLGILCTMFVEMLFIVVVYANYVTNPLNEEFLDGLLHWRAVVGHNLIYADLEHTSLVSQICAQSTAVHTSGGQISSFANFKAFRKSSLSGFEFLNGGLLCNLALVLWCFSIMEDINQTYRCTVAVLTQPHRGAHVKISADGIKIVSFSRMQVVFVLLFHTLPRFVIAISLGYVGILFLGYTTNVGDLVLNAVALVFILDIDEHLFQSCVPFQVKGVMRTVEPLSRPMLRESRSNPLEKVIVWTINGGYHILSFTIVSSIAAVWISNILLVGPFTENMDLALEYLCGGNQDFVCTIHKVNDAMMCSNTPAFDATKNIGMSYHKAAVLEKIGLPSVNLASMMPTETIPTNGNVEISISMLTGFHAGTIEYAASNAFCVDYSNEIGMDHAYPKVDDDDDMPKEARQFLKASQLVLKELLDDPKAENCSQMDFGGFCTSQDHRSARGVCAVRCGCHDAWQGNLFATIAAGCPASCDHAWQIAAYYLTPPSIARYTDRCEDVENDVLSKEPSFQNYVAAVLQYLDTKTDSANFSAVLPEGITGCTLIDGLNDNIPICTPGSIFRTPRLWCPYTCGCSPSDMAECPRSCSIHQRFQIVGPPDDGSLQACPVGAEIQSKDECGLAAKAFGLQVCVDTCEFAKDGKCDGIDICKAGTDCTDCEAPTAAPTPAPTPAACVDSADADILALSQGNVANCSAINALGLCSQEEPADLCPVTCGRCPQVPELNLPNAPPPRCTIEGSAAVVYWSAKNSDGTGPGGATASTHSPFGRPFWLLCRQFDTEPLDSEKKMGKLSREDVKLKAREKMQEFEERR